MPCFFLPLVFLRFRPWQESVRFQSYDFVRARGSVGSSEFSHLTYRVEHPFSAGVPSTHRFCVCWGGAVQLRFGMEALGRVALPTFGLGNSCSIHLSLSLIHISEPTRP